MTRSVKLGIASVVLAAGSVLPSPLNAVFATVSCVLGLLAAHQGSRWWLVVPITILTLSGILLYIGFHAV